MSKIETKDFYERKLYEKIETDMKLAGANLQLLEKKASKLRSELEELESAKDEWKQLQNDAEEKRLYPDPWLKKALIVDFRREVSLRMRGGDPEMQERFGRPVYGFWTQNKNRRAVSVPKLVRAGDKTRYQLEDVAIVDRRDNQEAYSEWCSYMEKGLHIEDSWSFIETFAKIERFFQNAPSLDRYGESYTVYENTGALYQQASEM